MNDIFVCGGRGNVTKLDLLNRLELFATLATRVNMSDVADFPLGSHVCHNCHVEKNNESKNSSRTFIGCHACLDWMAVAMEGGHLEPSQPSVGKVVGWPQRMIFIKSLWIDFMCWSNKQKISKDEIPLAIDFYSLLDRIFIRKDDKYEIPSLEQCRSAFNLLRDIYERT